MLRPNWLMWPVERSTQAFRVYVVEPREYNPEEHGGIFNAALTSLVSPSRSRRDPFEPPDGVLESVEPFDLITFPEAFLPIDKLLSALQQVSALESLGCVHVGLRPSTEANQHLFSARELRQLLQHLYDLPRIATEDLTYFSDWLKLQSDENHFNLGCLFAIDSQKYVRICLHPKLVRSKYETSPLHEDHMTEANLLTLVTLQPKNWAFLSVTLQPLLCSDALFIDTDHPQCRPLEAVTAHAECFEKPPPDHIDIVSVATCTPQPEPVTSGVRYRQWHQQFRSSFVRAASDAALARHHYSIFVIANFGVVRGGAAGGLSGAFLPIPLRYSPYPPFVTVSAWGRVSREDDNSWSQPAKDPPLAPEWSSLGYIASLDPFVDSSLPLARMLGFTITRLPRATTHWGNTNGLTDFQLRTAAFNIESGMVVFVREGSNA